MGRRNSKVIVGVRNSSIFFLVWKKKQKTSVKWKQEKRKNKLAKTQKKKRTSTDFGTTEKNAFFLNILFRYFWKFFYMFFIGKKKKKCITDWILIGNNDILIMACYDREEWNTKGKKKKGKKVHVILSIKEQGNL